jgi:dienelactone hydrolase
VNTNSFPFSLFMLATFMLATGALTWGCSSPASSNLIKQDAGSGGHMATGGATGTGGTIASGGVSSTGGGASGTVSSGGTKNTGVTGGSMSTAGTSATGGATGGAISTGGTKITGGTAGSGGRLSTGGNSARGGTTSTSGTRASGGSTSVDGGSSTGSDGPCNGGKWSTTDVTVKGPFETVSENVDGAILYRPKNMITGCLYPVITWGHGAGGSPSNYTTVLTMMASHGFVVIASTAGNVQDGGSSTNQFKNKMVEVAEWVIKQKDNSSSVLYQKIDTAKIGAAGHSQGGYGASEAGQNPLIKTSVSISGAVGSSNQKGPAFIICGGKDTNSGARCEDHPTATFNGTTGVPVFFGKCLNADHGNWGFEAMLADKTKPHDIVQATIAWFRYHLMGDEVYRSWFYGADCYLCKHANWNVQRKSME